LDDLTFIRKPADVDRDWRRSLPFPAIEDLDGTIEAVKRRFLQEGWEGDGEIGIIWIPPFVDAGPHDTHGTYVWHVKQENNGVSWLLSPVQLGFKRMEEQNPWDERLVKKGWLPENIIHMDVVPFMQELLESKERIAKQIALLNKGDSSDTTSEIISDLLMFQQGQILSRFYNFMDYCYLRLLQQVILNNNKEGIKLQRSKVALSLATYQPQDDPELENSSTWTLTSLLTDIWNAYKLEPADKKFEMLFKSVDFSPDQAVKSEINKHIEIRNCIQHHFGILTPDALKRLGIQSIDIRTSDPTKPIKIEEWKEIVLTEVEIIALCVTLSTLSQAFEKHIDIRIPFRTYTKPKTR